MNVVNIVNPIKSVLVTGNLQSGAVKYKLCPPSEFREGLWHICLSSIGVSCQIANVKEMCIVSCNLVNAQKYNKHNQIEVYEQPLVMTIINTGVKVQQFGYILFKIFYI